jgi:hypothetical protein
MQTAFQKIMIFGVLIFGLVFGLVLFIGNPKQLPMLVSFFVSLFFLVLCLASLILYLSKKKATNNEVIYKSVSNSLRQGLFIAVFAVSLLALGAIKLLTWWDAILLAASLILLELYFKSERKVAHE